MTTVARPFMTKCLQQHHHSEILFYSIQYFFYFNNFIYSMQELKLSFLKRNKNLNPLNTAYKVPKQYIDCKKLFQKKLQQTPGHKKKQLTTKQKSKFKKKFFLDQTIKPFQSIPSPSQYNQNYSTIKRYKSVSTFITKQKQTQNLGKRPTWIEDIQKYQQKYKPPGVGKYKLDEKSDFKIKKKSQSLQKLLKNGTKFNYLDDTVYVSSFIPGPGSHNPHKQIKKLKVNMLNIEAVKKQQSQKRKLYQKLNLSKLSSFSYSPVKDSTFDSISKQPKKLSTLMRKTVLDKRVGRSSSQRSPGPGAHDTINKWATQTFNRQKLIGKLQLFNKTTKSFPTLKVYH